MHRFAAALLLAVLWVSRAEAQTQVDLNLVLAVDVSGSINEARYELQRQGYAAAFRDPLVVQASRRARIRQSPFNAAAARPIRRWCVSWRSRAVPQASRSPAG